MSAIDEVRALQRAYDRALLVIDAVDVDKLTLVDQNLRLKAFAKDVEFLAQNYNLPEIGLACRNHVELCDHLNEALGMVKEDL
jgi:hypothetical protein